VPDAPPVTLIHSTSGAALHAQSRPIATTEIEPAPPPLSKVWLVGTIEKTHSGAPASCVTANAWPPIVIMPLLAAPLFAATVKATAPFPVPEVTDPSTIQLLSDAAVHAQPSPAVTAALPAPPADAKFWPAGDSVMAHGAPWFTVNVWPPTVIVPVRAAPVFAATLYAMVALPVPVAALVMVIHGTPAAAVHGHVEPVVSANDPVEAPAAAVTVDGAIVKVQAGGGGGIAPDCVTPRATPAIVAAPCRAVFDGFAVSVNWTVPGPAPFAPAVTVIQSADEAAVHGHDPGIDTATDNDRASGPTENDAGESVAAQTADAPACEIVTFCPATETLPLRAAPALALTVTVTLPGPLPFAPAVTWIHSAWLAAVHAQPPCESTRTVTDPPPAPTFADAGVAVNAQAAPSCEIVTWAVLTVIVPRRPPVSVFACTRNDTDPSPCPLASDVIAIHGALLAADHVQSRVVFTLNVPDAPVAGAAAIDAAAVTWHFEPLGDVVVTDVDPQPQPAIITASSHAHPNGRATIWRTKQLQGGCRDRRSRRQPPGWRHGARP